MDKACGKAVDVYSQTASANLSDDDICRLSSYITTGLPSENLNDFIDATCILTWAMTLQEPPMTFETAGIGKQTDEDRQKVLPSRNIDYDRMDEMVVDFYLEPTVLQGDKIMQTGRVKLCCPEQRR